jgi:hypothetical protein
MRRLLVAPLMTASSFSCESVGDQTRSRPSPGWTGRWAWSAFNTRTIEVTSARRESTT